MFGGVGGLGLAWVLIRIAPRLIPEDGLPAGLLLSLDARVVAFTTLITLGAGILFGLAPAWQLTGGSLAGAMRGGGRGVAGGSNRLLAALAMVEIAIAVMVVSGAGLFLRTLDRLSQVDPGFHAERVLTMQVSLPLSRYPTPAQALAFYRAAQPEIERLPGVRSASFGGSLPLTGFDIGQGVQIVGQAQTEPGLQSRSAHSRWWGRATLKRSAFRWRPDAPSPRTTMPRRNRWWSSTGSFAQVSHGMPAIGTHIRVHAMDPAGPRFVEREIVGVAGQVKVDGPGEAENAVEVYVPLAQNAWFGAQSRCGRRATRWP